MKKLLLFTISIFCFAFAKAQVTSSPTTPTRTSQVTLTFDATGTELENETGIFYAYTGVTLNGQRFQNIIVPNFSQNAGAPQFVNTGGNIYTLTLGTSLEQFYNIPAGSVVTEICLVIRNAAANKQTRPDIFIPVFQPGLNTVITSPANGSVIPAGQTRAITADSSINSTLSLTVNGAQVATTTGNTISTNFTFSATGNYTIAVNATSGAQNATDQISVFVPSPTVSQTRPANLKNGLNENPDGSVTLLLAAPLKNDVFVLGDFNNWQLNSAYQMKKDGDYFWLTIPAGTFTANTEHLYQYLVDYNLKIADPYSHLILDPNSDQFIKPGNYPNLKAYPTGLTTGDVTLFTFQKPAYNWTTTNFVKPNKENLVIYELLVRDFSEGDSYQEIINRINYLDKLGVNAIQLMPINEFEGTDSWGYNPKFHGAIDKAYGTPEKLKQLIDLCHARGIAVIIDVVYNHAFSQSPLAQMYWDTANNRPAANSPYLNPIAKHDFNVGFDFNHESSFTRDYVKQTAQYFIDEFKIDGFRFDLSKGFTQNNTLGNVSAWNQVDNSRIAILNDYRNTIWNASGNTTYLILEHLAVDAEEKILADAGFMLWGKMTDEYNQNSMGFASNANVQRSYFTSRNFNNQHLVAYAESHDEERLMYKNLQFGNNAVPTHNVRSLPIALDRQAAIAAILYAIPGPKMLWQFGELGYEIPIDQNGRTGRKPIPWTLNYDTNQDRLDLYNATATMIGFKTLYPATFNSTVNNLDVSGLTKRITLDGPVFDAVVVANFSVNAQNVNPSFTQTGTWYEYFTNTTVNVTNISTPINLQPGEYRVYSTQQLVNPLSNEDIVTTEKNIRLFPNPGTTYFKINEPAAQVIIYNLQGQTVKSFKNNESMFYDVADLTSGIYLINITDNSQKTTQLKFIKE